jgi:hypothetical protein
LGHLGTAATNRPVVPTPGDYDDGEFGGLMIGKGNRSTPRKPASLPLCPPEIPHAVPWREPGPPLCEARLIYGTAHIQYKPVYPPYLEAGCSVQKVRFCRSVVTKEALKAKHCGRDI